MAGESMMPTLWPTSSALIDRQRTTRRNGAIYELSTAEGFVLRRLIGAGERWRVAMDGPSMAPPRPMRQSEKIVGEAVWTGGFLPGSVRRERSGTS